MTCPRCMNGAGLCSDCEAYLCREEDDKAVVKSVWKSAHAVEDWPGKVTIRRFSPFKKIQIEGEGATEQEAWANIANRIRKIWERDPVEQKGAPHE